MIQLEMKQFNVLLNFFFSDFLGLSSKVCKFFFTPLSAA